MKVYEINALPCHLLAELNTLSELAYDVYAEVMVEGQTEPEDVTLLEVDTKQAKVLVLAPGGMILVCHINVTIREKEYLKACGRKHLKGREDEILTRFKVLMRSIALEQQRQGLRR